jgi:hypothetical protein
MHVVIRSGGKAERAMPQSHKKRHDADVLDWAGSLPSGPQCSRSPKWFYAAFDVWHAMFNAQTGKLRK